MYCATLGSQRYVFPDLVTLLAKASPLRSGDVLAGIAAQSGEERVAAQNALADLPTAANGTVFQRTVWDALRRIPVGKTISYGDLAIQIGRPTATRAVGLANGANPIAIVVPCHRVIGANASLTGYGGGLERKRWLLAHESAYPASRHESQLGLGL